MHATNNFILFTLTALSSLASGCVKANAPEPVGTARGAVGACNPANSGHDCIHLNGDGVHVAAGDQAGLRAGERPAWYLLGFTSGPSGVVANGWSEGSGPVDAEILASTLDGRAVTLRALRARGSSLSALTGDGAEIEGAALSRLEISLRIPAAGGARHLGVRLGSASLLPGRFDDVEGRALQIRDDDDASPSFTSYCRTAGGASMPAVFAEGVEWSPTDGTRTVGATRVGVACASGAAATCMSWGYRPWASARRGGELESLAEYHQACVHLKRAAYHGDASSFTTAGRAIEIADPFDPPIQRGAVDVVEAAWTADGAACVSAPRDPAAALAAGALSACPAEHTAKRGMLLSGVPR